MINAALINLWIKYIKNDSYGLKLLNKKKAIYKILILLFNTNQLGC